MPLWDYCVFLIDPAFFKKFSMTSAHCSKDSNTEQKPSYYLFCLCLHCSFLMAVLTELEICMYHNELKILTPFGPLLFVQEEKR